MLGSINNRGKVSEPCLSSPIITLHRGTLSIPPRPQRGSDQTAASLNGVLRRSGSEEILQGSKFAGFEKRLCAYSKKSLWCGRSSGRVVPPLAAGRSPTDDFLSS